MNRMRAYCNSEMTRSLPLHDLVCMQRRCGGHQNGCHGIWRLLGLLILLILPEWGLSFPSLCSLNNVFGGSLSHSLVHARARQDLLIRIRIRIRIGWLLGLAWRFYFRRSKDLALRCRVSHPIAGSADSADCRHRSVTTGHCRSHCDRTVVFRVRSYTSANNTIGS